MFQYIIMTVLEDKAIMYSGTSDDIDPNGIIGERWSYALYIQGDVCGVDYDSIWKKISGRSSICYHNIGDMKVCEIETKDDISLVQLYLDQCIRIGTIEYTYLLKRKEKGEIKLYCDIIKEYIHDKIQFIGFICNIIT